MSDLTKHTTAQVVAALSKHHDWTAEALECHEHGHAKAKVVSGRWSRMIEFMFCLGNNEWVMDPRPTIRSDWTIRRADGSTVDRKPRRKRFPAGKLAFIDGHWKSRGVTCIGELDKSKTYKLVAVGV